MKSPLLTLISLVVLINGFAQANKNDLGKSDPAAKAVLDGVSAKFKTFKTVKGNFTLEIKDAAGKMQGSKSGIVYMKGVKYRVSITGQEIFCDGKNVWTYDKAANEVQVDQFNQNGNGITPQKLFTNFYDKDFLYKLNGEKKVGSKILQEVELTPVDKTKPFFKVILLVEKASKMMTSTQIFEKSGNRYSYILSNISTNGNIADDLFFFDAKKYPGVEVVDLR
ncbi:MAG: LolA family protein [Chitinophagaceae bacterium]